MSNADIRPAIRRLLFVADAAVADVDELPRSVRTVIDAAAGALRHSGRAWSRARTWSSRLPVANSPEPLDDIGARVRTVDGRTQTE